MMKKIAYVFPGQGSQFVGMGADLVRDFEEAKNVFAEVDEALHQNLSKLIFSGDLGELTQTQNAQPAIMAVSMAVWQVLKANGVHMPDIVAGHSLGEYSALCAAGVLSLPDTAKVLQARGRAMAKACEKEKGGMLALLGATEEQAREIAQNTGCFVANDNAPGQVVLSGTLSSLEKAKELATQMTIKRAISLSVAGAFHSPLMESAADEMAPILHSTTFAQPKIHVFFNVTADEDVTPDNYADLLTQQIVSSVRWRELVLNTKATHFMECGPGTVLSGLIRRISSEVDVAAIGSSSQIKEFLNNQES